MVKPPNSNILSSPAETDLPSFNATEVRKLDSFYFQMDTHTDTSAEFISIFILFFFWSPILTNSINFKGDFCFFMLGLS